MAAEPEPEPEPEHAKFFEAAGAACGEADFTDFANALPAGLGLTVFDFAHCGWAVGQMLGNVPGLAEELRIEAAADMCGRLLSAFNLVDGYGAFAEYLSDAVRPGVMLAAKHFCESAAPAFLRGSRPREPPALIQPLALPGAAGSPSMLK